MITPDVLRGLAVLPGADALIPVINVVESLTMAHAATREAYEPRMKGSDGLS